MAWPKKTLTRPLIDLNNKETDGDNNEPQQYAIGWML